MAALLVPLFSLLMLLTTQGRGHPGVHDSLIAMSATVRELSELDAQLAEQTEAVLTPLNRALAMNTLLVAAQAQCPAALASYTVPALQAQAEAVRVTQDLLVAQATARVQAISLMKFSRTFTAPGRGLPQGPCQLPDFLRCPSQKILEVQHRDGAKPAGVLADTENCQEVRWEYADERVKELQ